MEGEPVAAWLGILTLTKKWEMAAIRQVALDELGKLPIKPVEKIRMCAQYGVERSWAVEAFVEVCCGDAPLTVETASSFGFELSVRIAEAREKIIARHLWEHPHMDSIRSCRTCGTTCAVCAGFHPQVDEARLIVLNTIINV